jgi:hypothetical protein
MRSLADRLLSTFALLLLGAFGGRTLFGADTEPASGPSLALSTWRDGSFQRDVELATTRRIAKREPFARAYNQLIWNVLGATPPGRWFVAGRHRELYAALSVREYCDPFRPTRANDMVLQAFTVQAAVLARMLHQHRRAFVVVITPSKTAFQPGDIPRFQCAGGEAPNRVAPRLVKALSQAGVPIVDGTLVTKLAASRYPARAFPRYGIHWNEWGAHPTLAEILRVEAAVLGAPPPTLEASTPTLVKESMEDARERAALMELYWAPRETEVPLVRFELDRRSARRATVVGDSFSTVIIEVLRRVGAYSSIEELRYLTEFHASHPGGIRREHLRLEDIDWPRNVFTSDTVILEMNEMLELPAYAQIFVNQAIRRMPSSLPPSEAGRPTQ